MLKAACRKRVESNSEISLNFYSTSIKHFVCSRLVLKPSEHSVNDLPNICSTSVQPLLTNRDFSNFFNLQLLRLEKIDNHLVVFLGFII